MVFMVLLIPLVLSVLLCLSLERWRVSREGGGSLVDQEGQVRAFCGSDWVLFRWCSGGAASSSASFVARTADSALVVSIHRSSN